VPSLIEQLQADALSGAVSITDLLRKAKTAATKLQANEFLAWIEHEVDGYRDRVELPQYRRIPAELKFFNPYHGWQPIIGSQHLQLFAQPISQIASLLEGNGDSFTAPCSRETVKHYAKKIGYTAEVRSHVSRAPLEGIVDAARNAVLDWALKLEAAGVRGEGLSFSQADADRARAVTINIGSIGNAVGLGSFGDHTTITATQTLSGGELAEAVTRLLDQLHRMLPASDLPRSIKEAAEAAAAELRTAAQTDPPDTSRLRQGLRALKQVMEHAAGHVVGAGVLALIAQIHPAL